MLWALPAMAQPVAELHPVSGRATQHTITKVKKKTTASVSLPFFDDFSYDSHVPDTALWEDANVYVNQTYGAAPPTLGVATFDGLNKDGLAYNLASIVVDSADALTSRDIDLSGTIDSVYLSFFWQAGGLGDQPDVINSDSLNLRFYNPQTEQWIHIWSISGVDSTGFKQEMIPIVESGYLRDGFKFRFTSFGASAGAFDTWNIDYIRLSDQRRFNDTIFTDPAFTRPHPSLLKSFESVPWFHYNTIASFENKTTLFLYYQRNLGFGQTLNLNLCVSDISSGGTSLTSNASGDATKDNGHNNYVETIYDCAIGSFALPNPPIDEFEITSLQTYTGTSSADKGPNDTVVRRQVFKNYYALDDGSAERSFQVRDNRGGFTIAKYNVAQKDSLRGLYLYFLPSEFDAEQNQFSIVIYENDNNLPGQLIYETDSLYTPRYTSTNFFLPYQLDKAVELNGPAFIGIRQVSNLRLPIGFDMNSERREKIYYGTLANLRESFFRGNLMMRPYLRYQPRDLAVAEIEPQSLELSVFPNPANSSIYIESSEDFDNLHFSISSISGQLMQSGKLTSEIVLANTIKSGLYLLRIEDPSGQRSPNIQKILVKR